MFFFFDTTSGQIDHDLDHLALPLPVVRGCAGSAKYTSNPARNMCSSSGCTGPTRQHELLIDQTIRTTSGSISDLKDLGHACDSAGR